MDTKTGRTTVVALNEPADEPRLDITWTITSPATSSSIAALDMMTPSRLLSRPLVLRMVNVVPREVEQRAAPAANACTGVAPSKAWRVKDKAMGSPTPMRATVPDRYRLAHKAVNEVDRPPEVRQLSNSRNELGEKAHPRRQSKSGQDSQAA